MDFYFDRMNFNANFKNFQKNFVGSWGRKQGNLTKRIPFKLEDYFLNEMPSKMYVKKLWLVAKAEEDF